MTTTTTTKEEEGETTTTTTTTTTYISIAETAAIAPLSQSSRSKIRKYSSLS
jgi:hypothetical protein